MLHLLCENFSEYPPDITIGIFKNSLFNSTTLFMFKNYKLYWLLHFFLALFSLSQNNKWFCWHRSTARDIDGGQEQRVRLIILLVARIFPSSFFFISKRKILGGNGRTGVALSKRESWNIWKIQKPFKYYSNKKFLSWKYSFNFETLKRDNALKKNKSLDISKTSQNSDVPTKIIKENAEFSTDFIHWELNEPIESANFAFNLKWADVTPIF